MLPSIKEVEGEPAAGDEVAVFSHEGTFIARGLFNPLSLIRVRLYRWEDQALDEAFWAEQIGSARQLRRDLLKLDKPGEGCRLVASEGDGLSGLTVDRYDRVLVVQLTSLALFERRELLLRLLTETTDIDSVVLRTEKGVATREGLDGKIPQEPVWGSWPEEPVTILEHGIRYEVDPRAGQKTGFFMDQRENRLAAARYAQGKRVLDLFCYTGGFGFNALVHGGASQTVGVDSSARAIELARRNAVMNGLAHARFEEADVFEAAARLRSEGERYGMVVCDPPKFARKAGAVDEALRAYTGLNRAAVELLEPGGVLVSCSCSGHVSREVFAQMLAKVAADSGRPIQFLEMRGQAADHPVSASCLESEYLKCFVCRVG